MHVEGMGTYVKSMWRICEIEWERVLMVRRD